MAHDHLNSLLRHLELRNAHETVVCCGGSLGHRLHPLRLAAVEKKLSGTASGVLNSARQVGSVVGVALLRSLIAQKSRFVSGFQVGLLIGGIALTVGCSLALLVRPERPVLA